MEVANPESQSRNLLIVDDDRSQAYLFEQMLNALGSAHNCHHVPGGQEALDFLNRRRPYENVPRPELIILDIHMPGVDGYAVLREIKRDAHLRCIPVIMFSRAAAEEMEECYHEHANACISKQDDYDDMLRAVQQIEQFWFQVVQLPAL